MIRHSYYSEREVVFIARRKVWRITMIKAGAIACGLFLATVLVAAPKLEAQFPAPPSTGIEPPQPKFPARDISGEVEQMTKRYGLSGEKATIVQAILEEQARKADDVAKNDSVVPEEKAHRMLSIKDEEIARVSDALAPEQRKKYLADVRPVPPPMSPPAGRDVSTAAAKE
jgi:hypothetical protein